jgi:hypothetical protein
VEGLFGCSQWSSATVSQTIVCDATVPDAYAEIPADPTDEELTRDWTLKVDDRVEIPRCRGDANRHCFAIQLCALRGRFAADVPVRIANHVGRQLGLPPSLFAAPPDRAATDTGSRPRPSLAARARTPWPGTGLRDYRELDVGRRERWGRWE